jgi:glycosyltransferase involved in cell wall biosynthesis
MRRTKVFLLQEIVPNYRIPVFSRISALDGVDLTVYYSDASATKKANNLKSADTIEGFRARKLPALDSRGNTFQFRFIWEILRCRPDIVISGHMGRIDTVLSLLLCKLLGIRFLWFQGGVPFKDPEKIHAYATKGLLNRWLGLNNPRLILSRVADGMIVYSSHAKQYFLQQGFKPDRIWVAHNSPDTEALARSRSTWLATPEILAAERARFAPKGQPILLMIGRLNKQRRVETLLAAISRLKSRGIDPSLILVGDGAERRTYEQQAQALGLPNVYFEGAVYDDHELCRYLLVSDIFVVPGVASLALKIAMAMGRPVVSADYGLEVHDIESGVNGHIFPLGDEHALADILERLLKSEEMTRELGNSALQTINEKININTMIEGFRRAILNETP